MRIISSHDHLKLSKLSCLKLLILSKTLLPFQHFVKVSPQLFPLMASPRLCSAMAGHATCPNFQPPAKNTKKLGAKNLMDKYSIHKFSLSLTLFCWVFSYSLDSDEQNGHYSDFDEPHEKGDH